MQELTQLSTFNLPNLINPRESIKRCLDSCPRNLDLVSLTFCRLQSNHARQKPGLLLLGLSGTRTLRALPPAASMDTLVASQEATPTKRGVYSVWAVPPEDVGRRLRVLMDGLREEFGGPQFEPHVTVVGAIELAQADAVEKLRAACEGLKAYSVNVDRTDAGTFFYQCVYLLLHPTPQVMEASIHCTSHFGYKSSTAYMPHLSLLYGDLTADEKKKAQEKASILDENISNLSFQVTRLALYRTDTEDKTLKSWEKVAECSLGGD